MIKHDDRVSLDRNPYTDEIKELKLKDIKRIKKLKNKKNNSVLVYFEQGVGDYIMFSRYLNLLSSYGFKVTAFGQEDVIVLFKNCKEFKGIKFEHLLYPDDFKKFKYKSFIQDLPFLLMEEEIPHPTVFDTKVIIEKNNKFLSEFRSNFKKNTQKIGVSWKGNKRHIYDKLRSIDIGLFSKIFKENPDIQFFVIDKGLNPYEKKEISKYSNVINCEKYLSDWNKTTTICLQMDQIVTVDTSLGHMGGTLNVPTNILISNNNDWRWGIKKTDSEWYKSVKLLRQTEFFKWEPVIEKVIKFLKK
jgi:ADP-heptose:LPS heptosyltransferase